MKLHLYCICGAYWRGEMPKKGADKIKEVWQKNHIGEGHGPCDAQTAACARAKSEASNYKKTHEN